MDFGGPLPLLGEPAISINPASQSSIGTGQLSVTSIPASFAWPSANRAFFIPFRLANPATVYQMACGTGTLTTGNFDLGIYDIAGNRLVSTGTTAKTTASSERIVNVTDTYLVGGLYYLAMATDGTANYFGWDFGSVGKAKAAGIRAMNTAFALPATATFATMADSVIPVVSARLRSE